MSEINPVNSSHALHRLNAQPSTSPPAPNGVHRGGDSVEVSETAALLAKIADLPETRVDLVNEVRKQLDAGKYDADGKKLDLAIDAMAEDL